MNNEIYSRIKEQLVPDDSVIDNLYNKIENDPQKKASNKTIKYIAAAASFLIIAAGALAFAKLNTPKTPKQNDQQNIASEKKDSTTSPTVTDASDDNSIKGLPVENFVISDNNSTIGVDRTATSKLTDFFIYELEDFVIAKVTDTRIEDSKDFPLDKLSISSVKVLQTICGSKIPDSFEVIQTTNVDFEDNKNLLREGGVYLLPISKYEEKYCINGDMDVLFEIDDKGLIYSHSRFEDFSKYDGQKYSVVIDKINKIYEDKDFLQLCSNFKYLLYNSNILEVTISSDMITKKDYAGDDYPSYKAKVNNNLSNSDVPSEIEINIFYDKKISLEKGNTYILCLSYYDEQYSLDDNHFATMKSDGTISNVDSKNNIFDGFEGYSLKQLKELFDKVDDYN